MSDYQNNAIDNRPKTTGTSPDDIEAFIAQHGLTDLDANPQAKPRNLNFVANRTCIDAAAEGRAKQKQAKADYRAALKNLDSGNAELRIKDKNRGAVTPKAASIPKPKKIAKLTQAQLERRRKQDCEYNRLKRIRDRNGRPSRLELKAARLADMTEKLRDGQSIKLANAAADKKHYWMQRNDVDELSQNLDLVKSKLFGCDDYMITLRQVVMTKPIDKTPFKGRDELARRLLDGEMVLAESWQDRPSAKQDSIAKFIKSNQVDITVIYQVTGRNKIIGWQIADSEL